MKLYIEDDEIAQYIGSTVQLVRQVATPEVREFFARKECYDAIGLSKPLTAEVYEKFEEQLYIWEIKELGESSVHGYTGFVGYNGPPFMFYVTTEGVKHSPDVGSDLLSFFGQLFFVYGADLELLFYTEEPLDEEIHDLLVERGFDHWDDNPTIDHSITRCYILTRTTYDAYYGDGADDDDYEY